MNVPTRIAEISLPPFDPLNARAADLRAAGHHVVSLGQALPFYGPPPSALRAARAALDGTQVNFYATDPGLPSLRTALAARLTEDGSPCDAGELVITAGANHAFTLAAMTLLSAGDEVVFPSPYFVNHHMTVRALGAVPIEAPIADRVTFAPRWDDIEPHLTGRSRAVVLCSPSNPTGTPIAAGEGVRIVDECARRGLVVFSDETYAPFVYGAPHWSAASVPDWRQTVVVVGTFSKAFGMMGWRVGFMLADAAVCAQALKIQDATIICAPVISQMAAEGAVRESWDYPRSFHAEMLRRRQVMADGLAAIDGVSWTPVDGGFFAFPRIEGCDDSMALTEALLEDAHVVTMPGATFGAAGEGHLRLSFGAASIDDLHEGLRRIAAFLGAGRR